MLARRPTSAHTSRLAKGVWLLGCLPSAACVLLQATSSAADPSQVAIGSSPSLDQRDRPRLRQRSAWEGWEDAPRLAADLQGHWPLEGQGFRPGGRLSGRYHFIPWFAVGSFVAYQRGYRTADLTAYPSEAAWGVLAELHLAPRSVIDPWVRAAGGVSLALGMPEGDFPYNARGGMGTRPMAEGSAGFGIGTKVWRIGPFATLGTDAHRLGIRVDFAWAEGR